MPRWPEGYIAGLWAKCPICGGKKDHDAKTCRRCQPKPIGCLGKKGILHPTWKGGMRIDEDGYVRTYAPDHPWPRRSRYVFEHIRLMELHLGRRLNSTETVHHKDHNRQNNELENLELIERGQHSSLHRKLDFHLRRRDIHGRLTVGKGGVECLKNAS